MLAKGVMADEKSWPSTNDYWRMMRAVAASEYAGMDINLILNTSYTYDPDERLHGGTVGVSIPLFSKKDKLANRSEASTFLSQGAVLIQKLETSLSQKKISIEQSKFLQSKFQHEGVVAVTAYFEALKQIGQIVKIRGIKLESSEEIVKKEKVEKDSKIRKIAVKKIIKKPIVKNVKHAGNKTAGNKEKKETK